MTSQHSADNTDNMNIKCEVCNYGRDARWLCTVCHNKMCLQCRTTHLGIKGNNNHRVIQIGMSSPVMKKTINCPLHHREMATKYCLDCKMLACDTCTYHKNHTSDTIQNVSDRLRKELLHNTSDMNIQLSNLHKKLQCLQENEKLYYKEIIETVNSINRRRQEWKSQIDKMANDVIHRLENLESQDLQILRKQELDINKQINTIKDQLTACEEKLQSNNDISVIKFATEISSVKQQNQKSSIMPINIHVYPPKFVISEVVKLQVDFGHLVNGRGEIQLDTMLNDKIEAPPTIDTTIMATLHSKNSTCIWTVNDKQAWYAHGFGSGGNEVTLVNIDGHIEKKVKLDFELFGIAVTKDGNLLLSKWHGHFVKKQNDKGQIVTIIDTAPFRTKGMCSTSENDILVCLSKDTKQSKILRITTTGQVKQTIKPKKQQKSLLTAPRLVTENINRDICVIDGHSSLVVVNQDGTPRFSYPDPSSNNQISRCDGIVCDQFGFILLSDCYNHQIHQIDQDGHFMQFILTDEHGIEFPWGMSIDNKQQLWICNSNGSEISVVKFRS